MTSIVTVIPASQMVKASGEGLAEHAFSVSNITGAPLTVGLKVLVDPPAQEGWFIIGGAAERELAANETDQIVVKARLPAETAPGQYKLRLLVFSAERGRAEEDFTEGPSVAVDLAAKISAPQAPPNGGFPWWIVAVAALVLVLGGTAAWWFWPRAVEVPPLTQLTRDEAVTKLEDLGLALGGEHTKFTGEAAGGTVIGQTPEAGTDVEKGSAVNLVIEAASVAVPNVVDKPIVDAQQALTAAGLAVADVKQERTGQKPGGTVLKQDPAAGQRVPPQTAVALTVEAESVQVPRLIGQTLAEATRALQGRQLTVGQVTQRRTGATPGVVLNQSPEEGQTLAPGSSVALTVEQQTISVPDLTRLSLDQAAQKLTSQGLKAGRISRQPTDQQAPDTVLGQQPKAGENVAPGSAVSLVVATAPPRTALTGKWACNDGGTYYLREDGNALYWYGERAEVNPPWANVFEGKISGDTIRGSWADVPKGRVGGQGTLQLKIGDGGKVLERTGVTGGFGGSRWTRR
jgi:beta-lactam-binding protein with PASTA domain